MKKARIISDVEEKMIDVTLYEYDCDGEITETTGDRTEFNFEDLDSVSSYDGERGAFIADDINDVIGALRSWEDLEYNTTSRKWFDADERANINKYNYHREVKIEEV